MSVVKNHSFSWGRGFIYFVLLLMVVFYLLPLVVMILTSLKSMDDIRAGNLMTLPQEWLLDAWQKAWGSACTGVKCEFNHHSRCFNFYFFGFAKRVCLNQMAV